MQSSEVAARPSRSALTVLGYIRRDALKAALLGAGLSAISGGVVAMASDFAVRLSFAVMGSISAIMAIRYGLVALRPQTDASLKVLAGYGPTLDALEIIDAQLARPETMTFSSLHLTPNWVVGMYAGIVAFPYWDIVGLCKSSVKHKYGTNWRVVVFLADGRHEVLHCRNEFVAVAVTPLLRMKALWADPRDNIKDLWLTERDTIVKEALQRRALLNPDNSSLEARR